MSMWLAKTDTFDTVAATVFVIVAGIVVIAAFWSALRKSFGKTQPIYRRFSRFLGRNFLEFQTHEKRFPGYDLPSVHRALKSYFEDHTDEVREVGGCYNTSLRKLFEAFMQGTRNARPTSINYERVPVDVDQEQSFPVSCLWLIQLKSPSAETRAERRERQAVMLSGENAAGYDEDFHANRAVRRELIVSIACRTREQADAFFAELETRRRKLSVYRGKVIDPQIIGHAINTIGLRQIREVRT